MLKKGIEHGSKYYNYACLLALTNKKAEALDYLNTSLQNKEITLDHVLRDSDWKNFLNDPDFKALIKFFSAP